jgi:tetratricopeptide (TPR) repeat protein
MSEADETCTEAAVESLSASVRKRFGSPICAHERAVSSEEAISGRFHRAPRAPTREAALSARPLPGPSPIAREQGRYEDALEHCRAAARIDDKHSSSEVWREIGITNLLAGNCDGARQALEKYLSRRPYDPEGDCWYGRTMARLGRCEEARTAFEQAIEAVRTMLPARKRQVRSWEFESRRELKKLPIRPPLRTSAVGEESHRA